MKRLVLSVALAAMPAFAQSQSLKQFLESADVHNVDRRLSLTQREAAAAQLTQAWSALLPSLSASGGWTHNQFEAVASLPTGMTVTRLVIVPADQLDAALRVDLPLIDAARWFRGLAVASASDAATEREAAARDQVKRQVVGTYYALAAAQALVRSAQKSLGVSEAQLALQTTRVKTGVVTELDALRARAEVERTKQLVADAKSLVATTGRSLRTVTGLEPAGDVSLPNDDLHAEADEASLESQVSNLPAIRAAMKDIESADRQAIASRLALVPTVSAQFTERFTNATGFQGQSALYNFGVNFAWRLDGPTVVTPRIAEAQKSASALTLERLSLAAKDQIFSDWQRIQASIIKVQATESQVEAAQRASALAKERYEAGVATQIDVIQSERDVFSAEVSQIQARAELASARASLRISAGQPVVTE
ncbi:MAG: TolC family protein [Archangium sp.]|nr:TolC family protein [Archangium sp.]